MSRQSKSLIHLPVLYNPFLNCIFNNPHYSKNTFKQTIHELSENHNDYTLLVPPAHILNNLFDPSTENAATKTPLHDLCYHNEDFIRSHIIKTNTTYPSVGSSKSMLNIYVTMNGKQILIKNGMVFTGKGFKTSLKLKVLDINYFNSFCDYFPKGSKFMVIYIEDSLFGNFDPNESLPVQSEKTEMKLDSTMKDQQFHDITFEKLLRSFPLLSNAVSDKFYKLFHHNNYQFRLLRTNTHKTLSSIKFEFQSMLDEAFKIVLDSVKIDTPDSEQTYHLINYIISIYPGIDLNKLVYEYVELNLYDKLWAQLIFQFDYPNTDKERTDPDAIKILTKEKYDQLECLSLNQLDVPTKKPWHMNELYTRIYKAIGEFSRLSDASIVNLCGKTQILKNTVNILTNNINQISEVESFTEKSGSDDITVNADILIGMLIMVIVHARVDNLEAHLYYVKHFNSIDYTNDGYFCYILSNFDAVIYHLSSSMNDEPQYIGLVKSSELNAKFWSLIETGNTENLLILLDEVQQNLGDSELPNNHFLNSRNVQGESCLMMAVKAGNMESFNKIVNYNYQWFSIDDILFDKNMTTNQTLLTVALTEGSYDIIIELVDLILSNTTLEEQKLYFNSADNSGRSIGHYFHHYPDLIDEIGFLIDWELKDNNSHTPLFSLCRCYDHPNYAILIEKGFNCIYKKYGKKPIDFDRHIDKMGNTILHIILKDISKTKLLTSKTNLVNVNQVNYKNMTPLDLYVKYNRFENLKELLKDDRLDFRYEDNNNFHSVFDYLGSLTARTSANKAIKDVEKLIYDYHFKTYYPNTNTEKIAALNARFDTAKKDWVIFFTKSSSKKSTLNSETLDRLRQFTYIFKLVNPYSFFPGNEAFWLNFPLEKSIVPMFAKYRVNRIIEHINMYMVSLKFHPTLTKEKVFQKYFTDNKNGLTLELINEITTKEESVKDRYSSLVLGVNQVDEIDFFLKFSLNDLLNFQTIIAKFNKLITIGDIKQSDLRIVIDRMLNKVFCSAIIPQEVLLDFNFPIASQYRNQDSSFGELLSFTAWLELSTIELTKNIRHILLKLDDWKALHGNIKELNNDLKKYEEDTPTCLSAVGADSATHSEVTAAAEASFNQTDTNGNLQHVNLLETEADEIADTSSSFFSFGNILENKRARYKKLLLIKAEEIKKIMKLNAELKLDHESIAAEISNFMNFKSNFVSLGIKRYTRSSLCLLKGRQYELTKLLNSCKR